MAKSLPKIPNTQKGNRGSGSVVASIGKNFLNKQQQLGKAGKTGSRPSKSRGAKASARGQRRGKQAQVSRPSSTSEAMEKIVNSSTVTNKNVTAGGNSAFYKKAFDVYTNLINFVKKSVQDLVQKVKTIIGLSRETKQPNEVSNTNISGSPKITGAPSVEETRETAEEKEKQTEIQTDSLSELSKINVTLEKIRKLVEKGGLGGAGGGGGLLDTVSDVVNIASFMRGGRGGAAGGASKLSRLGGIAKGGGLGKLAAARNASKPVQALARGSDKIVKTATAAKEGVKNFAGRAAGKASQMLGFGAKMGTAAAGVASAGGGAASGIASGAASGAAGSVAGGAAGGAAGSSGGWFSNLMGKLNPKEAIKKIINSGAGKILKAVTKVPVIGTIIEGFFAAADIQEIKNNPDMSPEEKRKAIGNRIASGLGGMIGGSLLASGATALSATGIPTFLLSGLAYYLGDMAGRWLTGTLMESIGGGETVYNLFSSIPGLGKYIAIDEDQQSEEAGKDVSSEVAAMEQGEPLPPPPPPTATPEPASLSSTMERTPSSSENATPSAPAQKTPEIQVTPEEFKKDPIGSYMKLKSMDEDQRIATEMALREAISGRNSGSSGQSSNVVNNYYNNTSGGGSAGNESSAATPSASPDPTMQKMLSENVGGVST